MSEQMAQYPPVDHHLNMIDSRRMADVEAANQRTLSAMLTTVLDRALPSCGVAGGDGKEEEEENSNSSGARFQGYDPEEVYRAVQFFTVVEKTAVLTELLDTHLEAYAVELRERLAATSLPPPPPPPPLAEDEGPPSPSASGGREAAEETDKKRRRLCKDGVAPLPSVLPATAPPASPLSPSSARCFRSLVGVWRRLVDACDEIQTVWASFASQYVSHRPPSSYYPGGGEAGPQQPWGFGGCVRTSPFSGVAYERGSHNVLTAALPALSVAVASGGEPIVGAAIDGYMAAIVTELEATHPLPTSHPSSPASGDEESTERAQWLPHALGEKGRRSDIAAFTALSLAIGVYMSRAQPAVVNALRDWYDKAAANMYAREVACGVYFRYASEAIALQKQMAQNALHPHTAPLLVEAVERGLLGDVGMEVVSRDLEAMFAEAADVASRQRKASSVVVAAGVGVAATTTTTTAAAVAPEGRDSLGRVWKLLSRCTHVPRDPVVQLFRHHIEGMCTDAVKAIVAAARGPPAPPSSVSQEAIREAVLHLLNLVRRTKLVIHHCFTPNEKIFSTQLHECLQRVLEPRHRIVVEVMAAFVDNVFKRLETGELLLLSEEKQTAPSNPKEAVVAGVAAGQNEEEEKEGEDTAPSGTLSIGSGEEILELVAFVCTHFPTMDAFEHLYWHDMGRRLLHPGRRVNLDAERCFLRIFEGICGNSFISKFEGMLRDMATSETLTEQYKGWVDAKGAVALAPPANASSPPQGSTKDLVPVESIPFEQLPQALDVELQFITDGLWPQRTSLPLQLPASMQRVIFSVEQFYHRLYAQRIVRWQHQLSHGVLKARLKRDAPARQLSGTLVQCAMLMFLDEHLASDEAAMSVKELCDGLGVDLEAPEVMGSLLGLCHARFGLLLCERGGSSESAASAPLSLLSPQDKLRINSDFVFATSKVRIPFQVRVEKPAMTPSTSSAAVDGAAGVGAVGGAEMSKDEEAAILRNEGHMIQIAVIQFMKAHGKAKHEELVQHLQTAKFNFTVTMPMVKKTMDRLIDRGFVERKGTDVYAYVA